MKFKYEFEKSLNDFLEWTIIIDRKTHLHGMFQQVEAQIVLQILCYWRLVRQLRTLFYALNRSEWSRAWMIMNWIPHHQGKGFCTNMNHAQHCVVDSQRNILELDQKDSVIQEPLEKWKRECKEHKFMIWSETVRNVLKNRL